MRTVKIVLGILAVLFLVAHAVTFPALLRLQPGPYTTVAWIAKFTGILIGLLVARVCFKGPRRRNELDDPDVVR